MVVLHNLLLSTTATCKGVARREGHRPGLSTSPTTAVRPGDEEKPTAGRGVGFAGHHGRPLFHGPAATETAAHVVTKVQLQRPHHHRSGFVQQQQQHGRDPLLKGRGTKIPLLPSSNPIFFVQILKTTYVFSSMYARAFLITGHICIIHKSFAL